MRPTTMRRFEGTVDSTSPAFAGLHAPATLTLIGHETEYECRFVFVLDGVSIPMTVFAPGSGGNKISGTATDPRGWETAFAAELAGNRVIGSYEQPHDHGTFELVEV
jgi:hypothetical protein